ncbi:protein kinase domain-containing protein [Nesterenkonia muleiensis]|uniref:protein kinase domain-containing protein n=1 Tax=Nesterenkonia muleiensis TaxID=2282648 RepID=UPI000E70B41D|nr:protein kinase [Nesterenkonia muleiensis]
MASTPRVPGLEPLRLLGVGGRSAVWLVRRTPAAEHTISWAGSAPPSTLALKLPLGAVRSTPALRAAREELEAMLPLAHEHVVRPWGVLRTPEGTAALLLEPYTAGSLAQLLRATGTLSVGETVTALTPVAQALAHVHACGAAHGDVTAANVLLTPEGRPALADLGDAVLLGMDSAHGSSQQDVAALAAVTWRCLTGREPEEVSLRVPLQSLRPDIPDQLVELLESALSPHAGERPLAGEFASELYCAAEPEPLNLLRHVDDEALAEVPTCLPATRKPGPQRWWTGLLARLRGAYRPS